MKGFLYVGDSFFLLSFSLSFYPDAGNLCQEIHAGWWFVNICCILLEGFFYVCTFAMGGNDVQEVVDPGRIIIPWTSGTPTLTPPRRPTMRLPILPDPSCWSHFQSLNRHPQNAQVTKQQQNRLCGNIWLMYVSSKKDDGRGEERVPWGN